MPILPPSQVKLIFSMPTMLHSTIKSTLSMKTRLNSKPMLMPLKLKLKTSSQRSMPGKLSKEDIKLKLILLMLKSFKSMEILTEDLSPNLNRLSLVFKLKFLLSKNKSISLSSSAMELSTTLFKLLMDRSLMSLPQAYSRLMLLKSMAKVTPILLKLY